MPKKLDLGIATNSTPSQAMSITLYHGTTDADLIPRYGLGLIKNDYGRGLYTTPDFDLACEWACGRLSQECKAYVYSYSCSLNDLSVFDFRDLKKQGALYWITELLQHRTLDDVDDYYGVVDFLITHFSTNADSHDIIIGYRADDSYFQFAQSFVNGVLGLEVLTACLEAGELGVQYCIKSQKAFDSLKFVERSEISGERYVKYSQRYAVRDRSARDYVHKLLKDSRSNIRNAILITDIMRNWRG